MVLGAAQLVQLATAAVVDQRLPAAVWTTLEVTAVAILVLGVESFASQDGTSRRAAAVIAVLAGVVLLTGALLPGTPLRVLANVLATGLFFGASALVLFAFPEISGRALTLLGLLLAGCTTTLLVVDNLLLSPGTTAMAAWLAALEPVATVVYGVGFLLLVASGRLTELGARADDLEKTQEHLLQLAEVDPLTRCANRHALRAWFESWDETDVVSVVLVDVDDLKGINDRHGHSAGDEALQLVARVLKSTTRTDDLVVRWGGDEFLVVLSGAGQLTAMRRFGNLIRLLTESASDFPYDEELRVSWGVSSCATREGITAALQQADEHMYANKGRRRTARRD
jgi:diguanylate cyclase (GGDEF)-like protein